MVAGLLGIGAELYKRKKDKRKKSKKKAYEQGFAAGQQDMGGGLGTSQMSAGGKTGRNKGRGMGVALRGGGAVSKR